MVKAHSLLYAVYVCLIVSILCGALLYFSSLYNQLNLFYNTNESLYIQNQSAVNYALGKGQLDNESITDDATGITSEFQKKQYGLLSILLTQSTVKNDTIASAFFVGQYSNNQTALYLANVVSKISASGDVFINGDVYLPNERLSEVYLQNKPNRINISGKKLQSQIQLPTIDGRFKEIYQQHRSKIINFNALERKNDSLYVNSFLDETKEIQLSSPVLNNVIIKGNFIITSKDSICLRKDTILEDVILMAPKVIISDGFVGNIQVFASENIKIGKKVMLNYPSALCVYNKTEKPSTIVIDEDSKIVGLVILYGDNLMQFDKNFIETKERSSVLGTIYCCGTLNLKSKVIGSVYANKIEYKTTASTNLNCLAELHIDALKRPSFFMELPIFDSKSSQYGIVKKIL
jgi:hypothetical protein